MGSRSGTVYNNVGKASKHHYRNSVPVATPLCCRASALPSLRDAILPGCSLGCVWWDDVSRSRRSTPFSRCIRYEVDCSRPGDLAGSVGWTRAGSVHGRVFGSPGRKPTAILLYTGCPVREFPRTHAGSHLDWWRTRRLRLGSRGRADSSWRYRSLESRIFAECELGKGGGAAAPGQFDRGLLGRVVFEGGVAGSAHGTPTCCGDHHVWHRFPGGDSTDFLALFGETIVVRTGWITPSPRARNSRSDHLPGGADPMIAGTMLNKQLRSSSTVANGFVQFSVVAALAAVFSYVVEDRIAGLAVLVLWFVWKIVPREEGPPVLELALTFQWAQVTAAVMYLGLTGRRIPEMDEVDSRLMVIIGLGCVISLALGLRIGAKLIKRDRRPARPSTRALHTPILVWAYLIATAGSGALTRFAWDIPQLTQPLLVLSLLRYSIFYLLARRFLFPRFRWHLAAALLAFEVLIGFSGYFAGFREGEVLVFMAILEILHPRRVRHWLALALVLILAGCTAILWLAIRTDIRAAVDTDETMAESQAARLRFAETISSKQITVFSDGFWPACDHLVSRMWTIPLPARVLNRVPSVLPHEQGAILKAALTHVVTPRIFFPDKQSLPSDSEEVRKYAGVWVAGPEQNTSIAFGYAAESYVDFGIPWMFVPVLGFGVVMGVAYKFFLHAIQDHELATGFVVATFWLSLYLFERSWVKTLGLAGTLMIYAGLATIVIDYYLLRPTREGQIAQRLRLIKTRVSHN